MLFQRFSQGGLVYHVLNRANGRLRIFKKSGDYAAFEKVLAQAQERLPMRILAYCVLANHWHLVLWPQEDGVLSAFTRWLTLTYTQRWHAHHHTAGIGHVYQGRFKSFPVATDESRTAEKDAKERFLTPFIFARAPKLS